MFVLVDFFIKLNQLLVLLGFDRKVFDQFDASNCLGNELMLISFILLVSSVSDLVKSVSELDYQISKDIWNDSYEQQCLGNQDEIPVNDK